MDPPENTVDTSVRLRFTSTVSFPKFYQNFTEPKETSTSSDSLFSQQANILYIPYSTFYDEKNRKSVQIYIPEGGIRVFNICNH